MNYPGKLTTTTIYPCPPKRLPPQCSIILKFVPCEISVDEIKEEVGSKYKSLFDIEEMRGTISRRNRHIRIDLTSHEEYVKILNGGVIAIDGQLIEVHEFLAPPRLLICSKCNTPGHIKKECKKEFDICRRCGKDRSVGEHKECIIQCHHCNGNHDATSFTCPLISDFRRELITKLKNKPSLLPRNVQLFIPNEYRSRGEKSGRILVNNTAVIQTQHQQQQVPRYNQTEWPNMNGNSETTAYPSAVWNSSTLERNNIWNEMAKTQSEFNVLKERFVKQEINLITKFNEQKFQLGSLLTVISVQVQQQNEGLKSVYSTLNKMIPITIKSLEMCLNISLRNAQNLNDVDDQEKLALGTIMQQIQTSITFLNEQNEHTSNKYSILLENFEKNKQLLQRGIELLMLVSE